MPLLLLLLLHRQLQIIFCLVLPYKHNIQVNGIGPGYIATAQIAPIGEGGHPFNDLVMMRTPANRWGEPEDIGNAALFLSSKASQFVNGHILYVDGGILANFGYVKGENDS